MVAQVAIRFTMWNLSAEQVDGLKPTRKMDMRFAVTGRVRAAKRRCNSSSSAGRLIGERRPAPDATATIGLDCLYLRNAGLLGVSL